MEYLKQALSLDKQADLLIERGLDADRDVLIQRLSIVSYYRQSGYLFPFREKDSNQFKKGTSLEVVWDRCCFDRKLRILVLDAIERIEVAVRTQLIYHFTHQYGPFGYCDDDCLPKLGIEDYLIWRVSLQEETRRSKEIFKQHFFRKYGENHKNLPLWMLAELMSMGSLLTFFRGVSPQLKSQVAKHFELTDELLMSWLRTLNAARNLCAHHARFWNRELGYPPKLPRARKNPEWHRDYKLKNNRCGIILMLCRYMLAHIFLPSQWHNRVEELFAEYPEIPPKQMGLPEDWANHPVWRPAASGKSLEPGSAFPRTC